MALISINNLSVGFRGPLLLDNVSCQIEAGQRIGLLGRNGMGKTTLLRILQGDLAPDDGQVILAPGAIVSHLPQEAPRGLDGAVLEVATRGIADVRHEEAWRVEQRARQLLAQMGLPLDAKVESLSTGMMRRVLLARALASNPDVLLLDEPTNHLDVESIIWLENFLKNCATTLLFVTHDRRFLQQLANRILEIDRGRLFDWSCDYETFLVRKAEALAVEERQAALYDKRLAEEEAWIRQGVKARRTRNEGRVRALEQMRRERSERQAPTSNVQMEIQSGARSGTLVASAESIHFSYDTRPIVRDFSMQIMRGDKIGVVGPNGAGKTTLLRVLLGQLTPQAGTVRLGTNLQIAYFDQLRMQLHEDRSVQDNVADGYETVQLNGQSRHVIGYLRDFLFSPERARTEVRFLSGGERNRVLLAKLFAKPANVLVLDEPTNDLDVETMELLEQQVVAFAGTVLVVSHDRAFLNNVVTSTLAFEEDGINEYVGGYDDWIRQRAARAANAAPAKPRDASKNSGAPEAVSPPDDSRKRRLTFKERQELEQLPAVIERLENDIQTLHAAMAQADYYRRASDVIAEEAARVKQMEAQLAETYQRWETLEQQAN